MLLLWRSGALLIGALIHTPQTPYPFSRHRLFPQWKRQHGISEIRGSSLGWGMFQLVHPTVALLLIAAAIKKVSKLQLKKKALNSFCDQVFLPLHISWEIYMVLEYWCQIPGCASSCSPLQWIDFAGTLHHRCKWSHLCMVGVAPAL